MSKMNYLAKALAVFLAVLMVVTAAPNKVMAEDPTIAEYENSVLANRLYQFDIDLSTYDKEKSTIPTKMTLGNQGDVFLAYYPDALDYYGEKKSIKLQIENLGPNRYKKAADQFLDENPDRKRGIVLQKDNDVMFYAAGYSYRVTYTFYEDSDFTQLAPVYAAIGFEDPDLGNYFYPANSQKLYYVDAKETTPKYNKKLSEIYTVASDGLKHFKENDTTTIHWSDYDHGIFAVPVLNESSFTYIEEGMHDYIYLMNNIFQTHAPYKVEYYYETSEGYPENPDYVVEETSVDIYEKSIVSITEDDKVPNPEKGAGYKLDEEMNKEWEKEINPDGSTVLRVYFEQSYTIKYDPNCTDATGEMKDDTYRKSASTMDSKETWSYVRPGYEFIGYKIENTGDLLTDPKDFKEYLLNEEDREVVLYAQWNPLEYTIKYNKNADDATGEMEDNVYLGSDETMPSADPWTFKRPGYEFIGYKIENTGDLLTDPEDFKDYLLKEEDREVVLYAQWNPLPYKIVYNKNASDATGEMADSDYTGEDATMPSTDPWTFQRVGYDFIGYKLENKGEIMNGSKEFKDVLLADEDRKIELYAQWDPWKYTIKYDPGCTKYSGEMNDQIFTYADPQMVSSKNKFKRNGYTFAGFVYTDKYGNQTLYKNVNDFRQILVDLGKNSEILLVAQWKKIPETPAYVAPVTGVE